MTRSILLAAVLLASPAVATAAPVPSPAPMVAVADIHHGTATVTDTDIPGGSVLIGLSAEAYWGTNDEGAEGIIFINPKTGGELVFIDGGGIDVDIDGDTATISNGTSSVTLSLSR